MKLPVHSATALTATAVLLTAAGLGGCADDPIAADLRSLHSSGPMSFLCLNAATDDSADFALPLDRCSGYRSSGVDDYSIPHLYALVTQSVRGEIAVVDLTTDSGAVLDQDPVTPGANFLPVGAQPVDIVSTPGSMASFVAVAEPAFEGIYALPSTKVRATPARLSTWPSCSLPATPGHMVLSLDPPDDDGNLRPSCDADYGDEDTGACGPDPANDPHCHGDLSAEAAQTAQAGRYKLIVTLPDEGGFAVIDAQDVLDREAGEFAPCTIERWIPLDATVPSPPPWPEPVEEACVNEDLGDPGPYASAFVPRPEAVVHDADRLYIADSAAPIIHVVDLPTPCEPIERPGLLPRSVEDPSRVVTTSQLALTPPTLDFRRYLYALDLIDGSVMVFDVSDQSTTNVPLERPDAVLNPFQPSDRIRFQAPPRAVVSLQHLNDEPDSSSGASIPLRCDPDGDGEGAVYRTSDAYDSGAGPVRLRGVFSFVVLASGDIVVIDVDDYDAPCRGPNAQHSLFGCGDGNGVNLETSSEYSCKTVTPHQPRAAGYLVQISDIAANQPGLQAFPVLFDAEGTALTIDEETPEGMQPPRLRATVPTDALPDDSELTLAVGAELRNLSTSNGELKNSSNSEATDSSEHTIAMNLEDPRAHILNQRWTVTYEGALPGFAGRFAHLTTDDGGETFELSDPSSVFCTTGVHSEQAVRDILVAQQGAPGEAADLADYVQIISSLPVETDGYWQEQAACSYTECRNGYGTVDQPNTTRDLRIVEAWSDRLALEPHAALADEPPLKCCFPGVVEFNVRPGGQWTVIGDGVGFLHHVVEDPDTGTCRDSCDPTAARRNGRARDNRYGFVDEEGEVHIHGADQSAPSVEDGSPNAFLNPFFRFAITRGRDCTDGGACTNRRSERDTQFNFVTQGGFAPLTLSLVGRDVNVQPQAIEYLTPTGELVISDGSLEGITLLDLNRLTINRQYN